MLTSPSKVSGRRICLLVCACQLRLNSHAVVSCCCALYSLFCSSWVILGEEHPCLSGSMNSLRLAALLWSMKSLSNARRKHQTLGA